MDWRVAGRPAGQTAWNKPLTEQPNRVNNGILMTWYTGTVANGMYEVKLVVIDNSANYQECSVTVTVKN